MVRSALLAAVAFLLVASAHAQVSIYVTSSSARFSNVQSGEIVTYEPTRQSCRNSTLTSGHRASAAAPACDGSPLGPVSAELRSAWVDSARHARRGYGSGWVEAGHQSARPSIEALPSGLRRIPGHAHGERKQHHYLSLPAGWRDVDQPLCGLGDPGRGRLPADPRLRPAPDRSGRGQSATAPAHPASRR